MPATPAIVIYYIYLCIELLPANAHSHIEEIDNDIKQCVSLQSFKQAIKGQLTERAIFIMLPQIILFIIHNLSSLVFKRSQVIVNSV